MRLMLMHGPTEAYVTSSESKQSVEPTVSFVDRRRHVSYFFKMRSYNLSIPIEWFDDRWKRPDSVEGDQREDSGCTEALQETPARHYDYIFMPLGLRWTINQAIEAVQ